MSSTLVFYIFSVVTVTSAVLCITRRSPVAAALWLVSTLFHLAGMYVLLDAQFIAAAQVLVYAGAIMVLFLFVIMLLNLGRPELSDIKSAGGKVIAAVAGLVLAFELYALQGVSVPAELRLPAGTLAEQTAREGAVGAVAMPLFQQYLVPFEITSIMLLAAVVGAVVLAKRRL